jgi:hypothetical protein
MLLRMATIDADIDALYAGALAAFTSARNALAKRAGDRAAEVRALAKPNAAAWAVNQLYWHKRPLFDALAKASQAKRDAVVRQLGGTSADAGAAETRHRAALDTALDAAVAFLKSAGDAATPATVDAIRHTLDAVPSPEVNGRLTRPLESIGFSVLSGLMASAGGVTHTRPPADVVVMKRRGAGSGAAEKKAAEAARRESAARKRERAAVAKALAAAASRERDATAAFTKAKHALEQADRRMASLEAELNEVRRSMGDLQDAASRARLAVNDAAAARVTIERRLKTLDDT